MNMPPFGTMGNVDMRGVLGRGDPLCFRTQGAMFCRCKMDSEPFPVLNHMLYPQTGILSVDGALLDIKHVPWGKHFWDEATRFPYGLREMTVTKAPTIPMGWGYYIELAFTGMTLDGMPLPCTWVCRGFGVRKGRSLVAHLWIIQRAFRRVIRVRREARELAVMMSLHPRLGAESPLSCLPVDVLTQKILCIG